MPQQAGSDNPNTADAPKWKHYPPGVCDFVADSTNGKTCARLVVTLGPDDFTHAYGPAGEAGGDMPIVGMPEGFRHQGSTSGVTSTVALVAYW